MKITRSLLAVAAVLATLPWCLADAASAPSAEGRWRLVEQRYENGAANVLAEERPLHLGFDRDGERVVGKIWAGEDSSSAVPWPAFAADAGPLPLEVLERREDRGTGEVTVRYLVTPSPEDSLVLDVTETYRPSSDGAALEGTMQVRFRDGEASRGGYTLHRRFERER